MIADPKCSRCRGSLLPEWGDYRLCPTCREEQARRVRESRATEEGRQRANAIRRACYLRNGEVENQRKRDVRLEKKIEGTCISCSESCAEDSNYCIKHRDTHRASARASYHRRKQASGTC